MAVFANTLVDNYEYISICDDAIDAAGEDFPHRWKLYCDGMGEAPLKIGEKPIRFKLRHVMPTERAFLVGLLKKADCSREEVYVAAAALALVGADDGDGNAVPIKREPTSFGTLRFPSATQDSLNRFTMETLFDLGGVVLERLATRPSS